MSRNDKGVVQIVIPLIILAVIAVVGYTLFVKKSPQGQPQMSNFSDRKSTSTFKIISQPMLLFTGGYADPTVTTLPNGKYIMYINNFSKQPSTYEAHTSTDGVTWTKTTASLPNASTGRIVKFGEKYRLYYPDQTPIRPSDPPASILSAISTDGTNFTKESGTRVDPISDHYLEGPTVFTLPDGTYRMLFSENETAMPEKRISKIWGASSKDGLTWTRDGKATLEADGKVEKLPEGQPNWVQALHPFVLTKSDGTYLMFYNTHSEVYAAKSKDGMTWTKLGSVGIHGADVDGYYQKDGAIRLYYGDFTPETKGVVYTTAIKEN